MRTSEVGTLIESLRGEFGTFGDGLAFVRDKVNTTHDMVVQNTKDITLIDVKISVMNDKLGKMENRMGNMEGRLITIETDVGILKTDVASIKNDFGPRLTSLEAVK